MTKRRVNVRAIIWHDGRLLAVKHKATDGSTSPYYATPGGGLDPFESLIDGTVRELLEETGIEARVGRLLFIQQFPSQRLGYDEELEFFFHIENSEDFTSIDLASTTHGKDELAVCEFVDPADIPLLPAFLSSIDIAHYIQMPQPILIRSEHLIG